MIFIAGISPREKVLDQNPRRCPVCGLNQAYHKRIDHYLSLFFIPLLRVKKGEPFVVCDRCEQTGHLTGPQFTGQPHAEANSCRSCGQALDKDFKYCPYCGQRL
jgi:RNA polymerase subunit RPABC4/transcription elongation factor Spt4